MYREIHVCMCIYIYICIHVHYYYYYHYYYLLLLSSLNVIDLQVRRYPVQLAALHKAVPAHQGGAYVHIYIYIERER